MPSGGCTGQVQGKEHVTTALGAGCGAAITADYGSSACGRQVPLLTEEQRGKLLRMVPPQPVMRSALSNLKAGSAEVGLTPPRHCWEQTELMVMCSPPPALDTEFLVSPRR